MSVEGRKTAITKPDLRPVCPTLHEGVEGMKRKNTKQSKFEPIQLLVSIHWPVYSYSRHAGCKWEKSYKNSCPAQEEDTGTRNRNMPSDQCLVFVLAIRRKAKGSVRTTATIDSRSNMPTWASKSRSHMSFMMQAVLWVTVPPIMYIIVKNIISVAGRDTL